MGQKQIFQTALTDVKINPTSYPEQLGTLRFENNATYKYVAFSGTTTIAAGAVLCYVAYATDATGTLVDAANTNFGAGVAMAALATGSKATGAVAYATGWIQIEGLAILSGTVTGTAGQALTTIGATASNIVVSAALTSGVVAVMYDPTAKAVFCTFPH